MMAISLIVYCVCEEKVVNISYSHKHWRDIKQGAHNDRTFLHHVKGSSQSYTMLNGQTFLLLYLGHLIVNFPYSSFYFRPPSPVFHTYPPFLAVQDSSIGDIVTESVTFWFQRQAFERLLGDFRETFERLLGDFWETFERLLRDFWDTFGRLLSDFWETFGTLGHILGISLAYLVHILGISWAYLRHI